MMRRKTLIGLAALITALGGCPGDDGRVYPGVCEIAVDEGDNGVIDSVEIRTYDADGNLLTVDLDSDNNGVMDSRTGYAYTFHGNGEPATTQVDADGDGTWETEYQYNESGQMVLLGWDDDGDGEADRGYRYTYGPSDLRQTEQYYDAWPFDSPNREKTYQYDSDGYLIEVESYNHIQQSVSGIETHTWNANHTVEDMENDLGNNGTVDMSYHAEYDLDGNQVLDEPDWDGDGQSDFIGTAIYAEGILIEYNLDNGADGVVNSRTTYTHDGKGNLTETSIDSPVDGTPDVVTTWSYDKNGNAVSSNWHDATDLSVTTYDYSCW